MVCAAAREVLVVDYRAVFTAMVFVLPRASTCSAQVLRMNVL